MKERMTQKIVTETKYVSTDGKVFDKKRECEAHERDLRYNNATQIESKLKHVNATNGYDSQGLSYDAECYYVHNQEEYDAVLRCWFIDNEDDADEFYVDKPQDDNWQFPLWVYISGREDYGYDVYRAEDYIKYIKEHIQTLENALAQSGAER